MLTALLLSLLVQGAAPLQSGSTGAQAAPRSDSLTGHVDADASTFAANDPLQLGMTASQPSVHTSVSVLSPPPIGYQFGLRPRVLQVLLTSTATGFEEPLLLQVPVKNAPLQPMLVAFHKFGANEDDVWNNTKLPLECAKRNWFLLSSLGASKKSFASVESQLNREEALAWVLKHYSRRIDRTRIYGAGFSMGGGSLLSYAARHQAQDDVRFAALVNHTGTVSLEHAWVNEVQEIHDVMVFWFGGSPFAKPFEFQRSSVLSFASSALTPVPDQSMCTNLTHVPMLVLNAAQDPIDYLVTQTQIFFAYMNSLGAQVDYLQLPGDEHAWDTIDAADLCDFLSSYTLQPLPLAGKLLADRSGGWFWFDIDQDVPGSFTPVEWEFIPDWNLVSILNTRNLSRLSLDVAASPLDVTKGVSVQVSAADFVADVVELRGYTQPPSQVLRDSKPTNAWSYDPVEGKVTLFESDTQLHAWRVMP